MKTLSILLTILVSTSGLSQAQTEDSRIKSIIAECESIKAGMASYAKQEKAILDNSTDGGKGTAYYKGKDLKYIHVMLLGESGNLELDYYYKEGKLIYVETKHHVFNRPYYYTAQTMEEYSDSVVYDPKLTKILTNTYYVEDKKLLKWIDNDGNVVDLAVEKNMKQPEDMIAYSDDLRKKLAK